MKNLNVIKGHRYFESQEKDEEVLLIVRMHWLILVMPFIFGTLASIVICLFVYLVLKNDSGLISASYSELIFRGLFSVTLLFGSLYVFGSWLTRYLNVLILTSKHVVDVTQTAFFARKVSTLSLENIEDVAIDKKGFLANIFDFGDVLIQTAGEQPNFDIDRVGDPEGIQKAIMVAKEKYCPSHPHAHSGKN